MERAVLWTALLTVIETYYPKSGRRERPPYQYKRAARRAGVYWGVALKPLVGEE